VFGGRVLSVVIASRFISLIRELVDEHRQTA
jgi:hypothetical protein